MHEEATIGLWCMPTVGYVQGTGGYTVCNLQIKQGTWSVHYIYPVMIVIVYSSIFAVYPVYILC